MICFFVFTLITTTVALDPPVDLNEIESYLTEFASYKKPSNALVASWETKEFNEAVKRFQREVGLKETGRVDGQTLSLMRQDRCGVTDNEGPQKYSIFISWRLYVKDRPLTYCITDYTKDLSEAVAKNAIDEAARIWTEHGNLEMKYVTGTECDIQFRWGVRDHGGYRAFDGPGRVLAHAFYPNIGWVHFDDDEYWTDKSYTGRNLLYVAIHELGHALGIRHSSVSSSVMYPTYRNYNPNFKIADDDIQAIKALYRMFFNF